jgi:hypothetical protein
MFGVAFEVELEEVDVIVEVEVEVVSGAVVG